MELRQLRVFLALAREGNFTRAAERVNLSQPALTQRIRALEEELGVPLFRRTARGAELTPAGEELRPHAERLLDDAALTVQRVRRAGGMIEDTLRVGFDYLELGSVPPMPSLLSAFRGRFPEAQALLQTLEPGELERALLEERLDIGFLLGPPLHSGLSFQPLLTGPYLAVLPADHLLARQETLTRPDLLTQRLLLPRLNSRDDAALHAWLPGARVVYKGADVASFAGLVAAGEGVALLPSGLVPVPGGSLSNGSLVVRVLEDAPTWTFGLAWRRALPTPFADLAHRLIRQLVPQAVEVRPVASEQPIVSGQTH